MKPMTYGNFCSACQKEVIDFRQMEMSEIINMDESTRGRVCSTYQLGQVDIMEKISPKQMNMKPWRVWYLGLLGILLAGTTEGQQTIELINLSAASYDVDQLEIDKERVQINDKVRPDQGGLVKKLDLEFYGDVVKVRGKVTDENGASLIGVSVFVQGKMMGTLTNIDGAFEMEIDSSLFQNEALVLIFSYTGFPSDSLLIVNDKKTIIKDLKVELTEELLSVPFEVVIGGAYKVSWGKRVWYKIKQFFSFQWL
jgi:hypothetical protein